VGTAGPEGAHLGDLVREVDPERTGALWRLRGPRRQMDANVVRLLPGGTVAEHVEAQVDVLLVTVAGGGRATLDGEPVELAPGRVALLPRGARRSLEAGGEGLTVLTAHRRRRGLTIGPAPQAAEAGTGASCTLHRVCRECGRHAIEADARYCSRCGTPLT
jgi:quercetin dioxygenase-like cupin family protein